MACGPFQSGRALIHSARTHGASPRVAFSGSFPDLTDRRSSALAPVHFRHPTKARQRFIAGWSSPVARQAHNLKVASSNLAPATRIDSDYQWISPPLAGFFMWRAIQTLAPLALSFDMASL